MSKHVELPVQAEIQEKKTLFLRQQIASKLVDDSKHVLTISSTLSCSHLIVQLAWGKEDELSLSISMLDIANAVIAEHAKGLRSPEKAEKGGDNE